MLYYPEAKLFSPSDISNCVLWLDANDLSTITDVSGFCSEWRDKSGNGRHATQSTVNARPQILTFLNSRNSLLFNGATSFLSINNALFSSLFFTEFFTVATSVFFTKNDFTRTIFCKRPASTSGVVLAKAAASPFTLFFDWGGGSNRYNIGTAAPPTNISISYVIERNATNRNAFINGNAFASASPGVSNPNTSVDMFIGRLETSTGFFDGYINEIIFYSRLLTATEKEKLTGYLNWKWQGVEYLPSNHPYKTRIPRRV